MPEFHSFPLADLTPPQRYKLLSAMVVPRPIALVGTCNADGSQNAAPFSFFTVFSEDPAVVILGLQVAPDGTPTPYPDGAFTAEPLARTRVAGRDVPTRWRLRLPQRRLDAEVAAINETAWNDLLYSYWEGPVRLSGSHEGIGYLEMTGYEWGGN